MPLSPLEPGEIEQDTPMSISRDAKLASPNIHNPSRDKIIIRPRCKTYAQKQRAIRCTLACFTAISLNNESSTDTSGTTTPSPPPPTENSTERPAKVVRFFKLGSEPATAKVHSGRIEKTLAKSSVANVLTQSQISHPVAINNIYSGCGEITATATPAVTAAASIGNPQYLHPSFELPSTQYPCTCCDPKCCPRCRLLALADRFCTIVAEREERLRMTDSVSR